ncbi:hypothetical protein CIG75_18700 [Tumebacillus algifaecis]|uniref:DUF304 domain-containing protein n=1 Tax=Tumebacillus algifaecis TaxID=1214604 RepID=A0A223D596_9BACL|nr:hypothetical protein [Tumebacillus algifaecis]ASS76768.1 hypothetical protein CIG75_18700 [Tumebacillus algifaecis]
MARIYRIRDTQRFLFLPLLFPLIPLLLQWMRPGNAVVLFGVVTIYVLFTFRMLFLRRELEIGEQEIRIDSGRWKQVYSHEQIYEIFLSKNQVVQMRIGERNRYIRILTPDYWDAMNAIQHFAWRHAIPVTDKRPKQLSGRRREVS